MSFDRAALQVEGEIEAGANATQRPKSSDRHDNADDEPPAAPVRKPQGPDPDLLVPAGQRERYEAAFARFCAVFPDAFYISERGRYFPTTPKTRAGS